MKILRNTSKYKTARKKDGTPRPRESPKHWLLPNYNTGTRIENKKKIKNSKITNPRMEYRINNTFDSTKGYPGEGPETDKPRGRKQEKSTIKGDEKYKTALLQWREKARIRKEIGKLNTVGHDIWYTAPENISYNNLKGK